MRQSASDAAPFERARPLLDAVFGASPFLRELLLRDLDFAAKAITTPPDALLAQVSHTLTETAASSANEADLKRAIRRARARAALLIALADLAGVWSLDRVSPKR